ncbi:unnamed protein product [Orchesella dallaii]|uniref:Metalloendopeptidase OMA1, mitochondrial n=1 Tax=Orchesella dallaii TaxID=48710 RepID=A0ABP1S8N6_9HEXA
MLTVSSRTLLCNKILKSTLYNSILDNLSLPLKNRHGFAHNAAVKYGHNEHVLRSKSIFTSPLRKSSENILKIHEVHPQWNCHFQTSSKRNALPAIVAHVIARFSKFGAMLLGRTVRRYWQKLPPNEKVIWKNDMKKNRNVISMIVGVILCGIYAYYLNHLYETPITKRKRFVAFTNEQILEMSKMQLDELLLENEGCIIPATKKGLEFYDRVVKVSNQLIRGNQDLPQIHDLEWTVTVVYDDKQINAFVLPCGSIFVYSGMLQLCDNDDQLGIILGHEMAHAVLSHSAEEVSLLQFWEYVYILPIAALWAILPSDLTAYIAHLMGSKMKEILMELPHSRLLEEEADKVGLILAAKACFDIREAPVVWAKMRLVDGDDSGIAWLSTHPTNEERQKVLDELLPEGINLREICQCPQLPHLDPRQKIAAYDKMFKIDFYHRKEKLYVPLNVNKDEMILQSSSPKSNC